MAQCENCWSKGHDPKDMTADPLKRTLIGPCCAPSEQPKAAFGVEFSSENGVRAFIQHSGLRVEFNKSAKELKEWAEEVS